MTCTQKIEATNVAFARSLNGYVDHGGGLTPGFASAAPGPGKAFRHEDVTKAAAIANQHAQFAPVSILVSARPGMEFERAAIDKFYHPFRGLVSKGKLKGAFWVTHLGCIDISNPDLVTIQPDRVTIDHACCAVAGVTLSKGLGRFDPDDFCFRVTGDQDEGSSCDHYGQRGRKQRAQSPIVNIALALNSHASALGCSFPS
jgi:hypothetical protein